MLSGLTDRDTVLGARKKRNSVFANVIKIIKYFSLEKEGIDVADFLWNKTADEVMREWKIDKPEDKLYFLRVIKGWSVDRTEYECARNGLRNKKSYGI